MREPARACQFIDTLLRLLKNVLASADKGYPTLIFGDRLLQADLPGLNPFDELLQPREGILKRKGRVGCRGG